MTKKSLAEAGEQENVNETVKYGETWHQRREGFFRVWLKRGDGDVSVSPWGERSQVTRDDVFPTK